MPSRVCVLDEWRVAKRAESKQRLREFALRMIEEIANTAQMKVT
jgi:hypothetical protein